MGNDTALTTTNAKPETKLDTMRALLEKAKPQLASVLPKHLTPDRLMRIALAAMSRSPKLMDCTPQSVLLSVMHAAQLGLEAGGPLGHAYLVPYRNKNGTMECQLIPGYRGLIELARRSGQIANIEAHVVRAGDRFRCAFGLSPVLEHEPDWGAESPGDLRCVYSVAHLKDGGTQVEVMTKAEVESIRKRSKASDSGPWMTDYDEMARKTVVRRLAKYLPMSTEMAQALALEEHAEQGESIATIDTDVARALEVTTPEIAQTAGGNGNSALRKMLGVVGGVQTAPTPGKSDQEKIEYIREDGKSRARGKHKSNGQVVIDDQRDAVASAPEVPGERAELIDKCHDLREVLDDDDYQAGSGGHDVFGQKLDIALLRSIRASLERINAERNGATQG